MIDWIVHTASPVTVLGGADIDDNQLSICLAAAPIVVAADGGADHALKAGLTPLAVIGDMDSASPAARVAFANVLHPVAEQDSTDFEKVLSRVDAPLIMAAGFLGGRLDHTLAVLGVLARRGAGHVVLISDSDACVLLPQGESAWDLPRGARAALLPLGLSRVTSRGLRWDLDDAAMAPDGLVSSSNQVGPGPVRFHVTGPVLLTVPQAAWPGIVAGVPQGR
ncbi:thiamine diphosphokinase [Loktanella fryxellensis]|uniref:Thiamine diphosphokinase n=1 Tax=Loktanella fryxellensis TaxID=245187 RepID=A0A1H8EM39_9RHOB|nr:thiamine diphosphokinase [Loktanella fryxellensis]SEN20450.1 thiamine diphosphokinase [Loktanella fryxellensis]